MTFETYQQQTNTSSTQNSSTIWRSIKTSSSQSNIDQYHLVSHDLYRFLYHDASKTDHGTIIENFSKLSS